MKQNVGCQRMVGYVIPYLIALKNLEIHLVRYTLGWGFQPGLNGTDHLNGDFQNRSSEGKTQHHYITIV